MERKKATDFDPELLDLFDRYVHGGVSRREFFDGAAKFAVGGVTAAALVESLSPNYAEAQQIAEGDARVTAETVEYASPQGAGTMNGYLVRPADASSTLPGVLVIHENRGTQSAHQRRCPPRRACRLLGVRAGRARAARRLSGHR